MAVTAEHDGGRAGGVAPTGVPRGPWTALWRRVRPHRRALGVAIGLGLVGAAADLAQPLAAKFVIEALADDRSLLGPVIVLVGLVVAGAGVAAVHHWLLERTAERIARDTRVGLAGRILRLRVPDIARLSSGDLLSRVGSDTTLLRAVGTNGIAGGVNGALSLVGSIALMAIVDWRLLLVTLGVLAVILVSVLTILPRIGTATARAQESMATITSRLEGTLAAIRTVKASGAEAREQAALTVAADDAYRHGLVAARIAAFSTVLAGVGLQVAFLAVLGFGGAWVADGSLSIGSLVAFLLYLFYLAEPITLLTMAGTQLQSGFAAIGRIDEVDALPIEETHAVSPDSDAVASTGPAVRFEQVSFRYRDTGPPVLDGIDLEVPATGHTAIVGPSGAGKSTLFSLIERFFAPDRGRVVVLGRDTATMPLAELRALIGYVEQDAPLIAGSLRENLTYAAPDATDAEIADVLRRTRLDGMVARLPDGLDSQVGERGGALSGGERQRVAIARALLRRPSLLLLDEATSQLDAVNEQALRETVEQAAKDCAVLVIAHRLSTVVAADRIVVLDTGRIRSTGTHDELLASDDLYRALATTQLIAET